MKYLLKGIMACTMVAIIACSSDNSADSTNNQASTKPEKPLVVPTFNADSAYAHVEQQLAFGPRNPGSPGIEAFRSWVIGKFEGYGARVTQQPFDAAFHFGETHPSVNIMASFNTGAKARVMLAAHYDTRYMAEEDENESRRDSPIPGADDGGSGVAVILEMARLLSETPVEIGVDFVLFDAEDQGQRSNDGGANETWCLGSQYWGQNKPATYRPKYGILLDMVGARGAFFNKEDVSRVHANAQQVHRLYNKVWNLANAMGKSRYFQDRTIGGIIDDHYFVNKLTGIPMIDIINKPPNSTEGFGPHWHTHGDDISIIDKNTLRSVGQVVTAVVYRENAGKF